MKISKILIVLLLNIGGYVNAQSLVHSNGHSNDSLNLKAKKLKQLYLLSTASSKDVSNIYKQQFFDCFPNTFKQLDELYGDHEGADHKPAPLNDQAEKHIADLFNNLDDINDTLYYRKIVSIAVGGHWDADAVNFFQHGLRSRVLGNMALTVHILKGLSNDKIQSFWYFYFDGPVVKKPIGESLQKIKAINNRIYDLMVKAHDDAFKQNQ